MQVKWKSDKRNLKILFYKILKWEGIFPNAEDIRVGLSSTVDGIHGISQALHRKTRVLDILHLV
jgi:hypothetical protein